MPIIKLLPNPKADSGTKDRHQAHHRMHVMDCGCTWCRDCPWWTTENCREWH